MIALYKTSVYFSTDESCMMCHVHPHVENSWKLSKHVNNGSGVKTHCVACHLPPQTNTWKHYSAKAKLGMKDVWSYLTKDSADFNWETKSELEHAVKYIPNESCKECHQNLFPEGITDDGVTAHLYYDENEKKLDLQCISCHLDAGHYNPNYNHSKMVGIPGQNTSGASSDTSLFFKEPTTVTSFTDYVEQIPGTMVSFKMIAIPGGSFKMGSEEKEAFHKADESPVHHQVIKEGKTSEKLEHSFKDGKCMECGADEEVVKSEKDGYYEISTFDQLITYLKNVESGISGKLINDIEFPENYDDEDDVIGRKTQ